MVFNRQRTYTEPGLLKLSPHKCILCSRCWFSLWSLEYCASKGNSVADEYISKVQLGTINNTLLEEQVIVITLPLRPT
jgi:hypothetical protein